MDKVNATEYGKIMSLSVIIKIFQDNFIYKGTTRLTCREKDILSCMLSQSKTWVSKCLLIPNNENN